MALIVGTNSYINLTNADTYFADRLNSDVWDSATASNKEKALIQATKILDSMTFIGTRSKSTQILKFPRLFPIDFTLDGFIIDSATVPQNILDAVCELAIYLLSEDYTASNDLSDFNSVTLGSISVSTKTTMGGAWGMKILPPLVYALISPFQSSSLVVRG